MIVRALTFLLLVAFVPLRSQSLQYIDTVVVSTGQLPLKVSETGRDITVIKSDALKALPASSIDEVLQTIPGVEVQSRNGFGAQGDILMRGSTFTQVLVLIDGMKMNDPLTAHFNSNIPVTTDEIERIEILRGPAAAMYGPDAVGGVINIITKVFSENNESEKELGVEIGTGSHQQWFGKVSGLKSFDRLKLSGSFQMNKSDGELIPAITTPDNSELPAYRNYFDVKTAGVSVGYLMKNGIKIKARSGYDFRDFSARYFYTSSPFDKGMETVTSWFNAIELSKSTGQTTTDLQIGFKKGTDEFVFSPDFPSTNYHETTYFNLLGNRYQIISESLSLKFGAQIDKRAVESSDRGDHQDWHFGGYAMGVFHGDKYSLSGSLRLDYDQNYDLELSPQLNFSYKLGRWILRSAIGKSIRAADYTERYVSNNLENLTPGRNLGNPDLLAESSWSEEVGGDFNLLPSLVLKGTVFFRQSERLIDYVLTNESEIGDVGDLQPDADYYFAENISKVKTLGFDISASYSKLINENSHVDLLLGYSHIETTNDDGVVSVYLANHARDLLNISTVYNWNNMNFSLTGLYKNRDERQALAIGQTLDASYFLMSAKVGILLKSHFRINFQVQNLFDKKYQNILGAQMPGRWFMGSVGYRL